MANSRKDGHSGGLRTYSCEEYDPVEWEKSCKQSRGDYTDREFDAICRGAAVLVLVGAAGFGAYKYNAAQELEEAERKAYLTPQGKAEDQRRIDEMLRKRTESCQEIAGRNSAVAIMPHPDKANLHTAVGSIKVPGEEAKKLIDPYGKITDGYSIEVNVPSLGIGRQVGVTPESSGWVKSIVGADAARNRNIIKCDNSQEVVFKNSDVPVEGKNYLDVNNTLPGSVLIDTYGKNFGNIRKEISEIEKSVKDEGKVPVLVGVSYPEEIVNAQASAYFNLQDPQDVKKAMGGSGEAFPITVNFNGNTKRVNVTPEEFAKHLSEKVIGVIKSFSQKEQAAER